MSNETIYEKAERLLRDGRVVLLEAGDTSNGLRLLYEVVGDSHIWTVCYDDYGPYCDCPATRRCSHEVAVFAFRHGGG